MAKVRGVRWGRHDRYDRVVVDLRGIAAYRLDPTSSKPGEGDAASVTLTLMPAALEDGVVIPTISDAAACVRVRLLASQPEQVQFRVDLRRDSGVRVMRLDQPDRVVLDFAHPPVLMSSKGLRRGDRSPSVATLQWWLTQLLQRRVAVDAVFGSATFDATQEFQRKSGLVVDGVAGHQTTAAAEKALGLKRFDRIRTGDVRLAADLIYDTLDEPDDDALRTALQEIFAVLEVPIISLQRHPHDAVEHRRLRLPYVLDEQVDLLVAGMRAGILVTLSSFVAMWQSRGLAPRSPAETPLNSSTFAQFLTGHLTAADIDRSELLLALVAALGESRARRANKIATTTSASRPDPGPDEDGSLDALQLHLLSLAFVTLASPK